jgi:hypothetical protein
VQTMQFLLNRRSLFLTGVLLLAALAYIVFGQFLFATASNGDSNNRPDRNGAQVMYLTGPQEGEPVDIALAYLRAIPTELGVTAVDLDNLIITDHYTSNHNGVTHIYLRQQYNGIDVFGANLNVNVAPDGSVMNVGNRSVANLAGRANTTSPGLSVIQGLQVAAEILDLQLIDHPSIQIPAAGADQAATLSPSGISLEPITARLVYVQAEDALRLAWQYGIYELSAQHYWLISVDAITGERLALEDWVIHDTWGKDGDVTYQPAAMFHGEKLPGFTADLALAALEAAQPETTTGTSSWPFAANGLVDGASYRVFEIPKEYPDDGPRTLVVDPADPLASPFGWHDTNGVPGPEFTITRGNNVHAYADRNNNGSPDPGSEPDGGASLVFDNPMDLTQEPDAYIHAAVTNLFYWNNLNHDIFYLYGFNEVAGNFQVNNYGRGGIGGDDVRAEAQDGADVGNRNNANFFTPAEGSRPRMQMYLWNLTSPERDGDLSSMIITHEYGHGVSIRLTGGPGTVSCLNNQEQMGEGWSDYLGLILTMHPDDLPETSRGVGTYALGQPPSGAGIRPAPYSTDFGLNNYTYANLPAMAVPHGVGFVWATMIWDMTWNLVEKHGFNADIYGDWSTGGNNLALQLVMDGLKFQPCSPGFVDGRDAILLADQALTGGQNQCDIWSAFADRGLGFSASQGSSNNSNDGTPAFDMPTSCMFVEVVPDTQSACVGDVVAYDVSVGAAFTPPVALSVAGLPANTSASFDPNPVMSVPDVSEMSVTTTAASPPGVYDLVISGVDAGQTFTSTVGLVVLDDVPAAVTLQSPTNGAIGIDFNPEFAWTGAAGTDNYLLEVATDASFNDIVYTANVATNEHRATSPLAAGVTHYWRVTATNACGEGAVSSTFQFSVTLSSLACNLAPVDFEAGIPGDWVVTNDSPSGDGIEWVTTADSDCGIPNRTNGGGEAACADSDAAGSGSPAYDTSLVSPAFSLLAAEAHWEMDAYYRDLNAGTNDTLQFDIWNGATWVNLLTWNENHTAGEFVSLDLSAYVGMSDLQVRYRYSGNGWDWYAQVDNVAIRCEGAFFGVAASDHEPVTADPDTTASHTVTVTNTGTMNDVFDLSLIGYNWTTSHDIPATIALDAGESASFTVEVTVPTAALAGESDTAVFVATSQGDPLQWASADLTTIAATVYDFSLMAVETELSGEVGTAVIYTLSLTNLGNSSVTFDIGLAGSSWTTGVDPTTIVLAPADVGELVVTVMIPAEAAPGSSDSVEVTAALQDDPAQSAAITLTTTATTGESYLYLPLIIGN